MAKKNQRKLNPRDVLGSLEDFVTKKIDAEHRLADSFCLFIKLADGGYFISGGPVSSERYTSVNFTAICLGATTIESALGYDLLVRLGSVVSGQFSEEDFYSTVALEFLANYMKDQLEDMRSPRALALEFLILDHISNKLIRISFDGDFKIDNLDSTNGAFFVIGDYDKNGKKSGEFRDCLVNSIGGNLELENVKNCAIALGKKYKLTDVYVQKISLLTNPM